MAKYDMESFLKRFAKYCDMDISFVKPVSDELIQNFEKTVTVLPEDLKQLYTVTNGFFSVYIDVLPILDRNNIKRTWDSIEKANSSNTKFLVSSELLEHFCIFAQVRSNVAQALLFSKDMYDYFYQDMNDNKVKPADMSLQKLLLYMQELGELD